MTRSLYQQNNFTSGVLEPRLKGRIDIQQYYNGLQTGDNVLCLPQGGIRLRPGLVFEDEIDGPGNVRLINFEVSTTQNFLCVFTELQLKIYDVSNPIVGLKQTIVTNYADSEVKQINAAQLENVLLLVQEKHAPARLIYDPLFDNFSLTNIPFINIPQIDFNDGNSPATTDDIQELDYTSFGEGDRYRIVVDSIETEDIVFSYVVATHELNITNALLRHPLTGNDGVSVVFNPLAPTKSTITLSGSSIIGGPQWIAYVISTVDGSTDNVISVTQTQQGVTRKEDAWSVTRFYPRTVVFHQGRLYFGGTPSRKQSLFGSRSTNFFDFELAEQLDDDAIFITIATNQLNEITNLVSGRQLQVFTTGAEFFVPPEIPTPNNFEIRAQTNHGTSGINPVQIDGSTLFLERKGKTLRDFIFEDVEQSYTAASVSSLAQHLLNNPVDMAAQKGTASDDANYVLICNGDGSLTVFNTLREQQVGAFTRCLTNGKFIAVEVSDDIAYFAIEREINSATVRYLEKWSFDSVFDSSVVRTFGSPTDTITGLDHLEGETVKVIADGAVLEDLTVSGGEITLPREATTVDIGFWSPPVIVSMPFAADSQTGNNAMRYKSIVRTSLRVHETVSLNYDGVTVPAREFATASMSPLNTVPDPYTGIIPDLETNIGWQNDEQPIITQEVPGDFTLLAVIYELEAR